MFEEEVEILVVEPEVIKAQEETAQGSYRLPEWIKLINHYKKNQSWSKLDQAIIEMSRRFLLKQSFWVTQFQQHFKRFQESPKPQQLETLFEIVEKALEHGHYFQFAKLVSNTIVSLFEKGLMRFTLAEAKMLQIISVFNQRIEHGYYFYERLRKLYAGLENKSQQKTREAYQREIEHHFICVDVIFDEYKLWEKRREEVDKARAVYESVKFLPEEIVRNIEERQLEKIPPKVALNVLEDENIFDEDLYLKILQKNLGKNEALVRLRRASKLGKLCEVYLKALERSKGEVSHHARNDLEEEILCRKKLDGEYQRVINTIDAKNKASIERMYLQVLVRRINKHLTRHMSQEYLDGWSDDVIIFRQTIAKYIDSYTDPNMLEQLNRYWLDIETYVIKDKDYVTNMCNEGLRNNSKNDNKNSRTNNNNRQPKNFIEFANRLIYLSDVTGARNVLRRGIKESTDELEMMRRNRWFESIYGDTQSLDQLNAIQNSLGHEDDIYSNPEFDIEQQQVQKTLKKKHYQQSANSNNGTNMQQHLSNTNPPSSQQSQNNSTTKQQSHIQQTSLKTGAELLSNKIQKEQKKRYHGDTQKTVFVKGIPADWEEKDIIGLFKEKDAIMDVRIVKDNKDVSKGFCYVDFSNAEIAHEECEHFSHPQIKAYLSKPPKQYDTEERTIFLCALPASVTEEKVRQLITAEHRQDIKEIRLIVSEQHGKGFAYVEFQSPEQKNEVFEQLSGRKKLVVDGKKIIVQECDSDRQKGKKHLQVIFVKGLAFKANERDVQDYFKNQLLESIKRVEIVRDDKNRSKGIGFVEFEKFKDFQGALDLKTGELLGRRFQILRSDRPITTKRNNEEAPKSNDEFRKFLSR